MEEAPEAPVTPGQMVDIVKARMVLLEGAPDVLGEPPRCRRACLETTETPAGKPSRLTRLLPSQTP